MEIKLSEYHLKKTETCVILYTSDKCPSCIQLKLKIKSPVPVYELRIDLIPVNYIPIEIVSVPTIEWFHQSKLVDSLNDYSPDSFEKKMNNFLLYIHK